MKYGNIIWIFILIIFSASINFSKADDIEEFEIEGFAINQSLLNFYSKDQINRKKKNIKFGKNKFKDYKKIYKDKRNTRYDRVVLYFKSDDKNYLIKQISARKYYKDNISQCYEIQKIISIEVENLILSSEKIESGIEKMRRYPNGNSYLKSIFFYLNDGAILNIVCYDYSPKDTKSKDRLSLVLTTNEYSKWVSSNDKK